MPKDSTTEELSEDLCLAVRRSKLDGFTIGAVLASQLIGHCGGVKEALAMIQGVERAFGVKAVLGAVKSAERKTGN